MYFLLVIDTNTTNYFLSVIDKKAVPFSAHFFKVGRRSTTSTSSSKGNDLFTFLDIGYIPLRRREVRFTASCS